MWLSVVSSNYSPKNVYYILDLNSGYLRCSVQKIRSVLSGIEKMQFTFSCGKFFLNILLSQFFYKFLYFPFLILRLYTIMCPSETFPVINSSSTVTNITNTHCHSQHSPLLLFYQHQFSYIIFNKSEHFHQFPNSHDRRQLTAIIFNDCDRKCSWHINVRDYYKIISVDWSQMVSSCNSFCLTTISTYLHSISFVSQNRCSEKIPYWLRLSRLLKGLMCKSASVPIVWMRVWLQICICNFLSFFCFVFWISSFLCEELVAHSEESCRVCVCMSNCVWSIKLNKQSL